MRDNQLCPNCGYLAPAYANFCKKCGTKVKEICDCWVYEKPYNCGNPKCPENATYLHMTERSKNGY